MVISVAVLFITVKEPKLYKKQRILQSEHPEWETWESEEGVSGALPREVKRSLIFILLSIFLWFMGYNAVTTWYTTYVSRIMGQSLGGASTCLLIATGGAIVSYIPIGIISSKIGRKKTILLGVFLLALSFMGTCVLTLTFDSINFIMFVCFALVGMAWAAINVNSLPMVVEMCKGSDVGKFTGYYYTFSMAAQVITPILSGYLLSAVSYKILFPYAAFFALLSSVTMCFVRHGDGKEPPKKGLDAFRSMDD